MAFVTMACFLNLVILLPQGANLKCPWTEMSDSINLYDDGSAQFTKGRWSGEVRLCHAGLKRPWCKMPLLPQKAANSKLEES
jgi:hypothetical protein